MKSSNTNNSAKIQRIATDNFNKKKKELNLSTLNLYLAFCADVWHDVLKFKKWANLLTLNISNNWRVISLLPD